MRADKDQRVSLLQDHAELISMDLAYAVKDLGYAAWDDDPALAEEAACVLAMLAERLQHPEATALTAWMQGIAALAAGQLEEALTALVAAAQQFVQLGQPLMAARVQVSQLVALGLLGRYEEALACGLAARDVLLQYYDETTAGRVELNLGHLAFRRDRYDEAELYYRLAYYRFSRTDDPALLAGVENALADVLVRKQAFAEAQALYEQALQRAIEAKLGVIQALTECNLGNLALAQGRYDQALEYLEQSRRHYAALDLPHESAYADLELAEAYLELNLAAEADAILRRVTPVFTQLGMRAEEAWALAHHGQAALLLGNTTVARQHFQAARQLFVAEGNTVATALVALFEAHLLYHIQQYAAAAELAAEAEGVFRAAQDHLRRLFAAWLRGEALRAAGQADEAEACLCATLREAEASALPKSRSVARRRSVCWLLVAAIWRPLKRCSSGRCNWSKICARRCRQKSSVSRLSPINWPHFKRWRGFALILAVKLRRSAMSNAPAPARWLRCWAAPLCACFIHAIRLSEKPSNGSMSCASS